jgi:hypothetical protein
LQKTERSARPAVSSRPGLGLILTYNLKSKIMKNLLHITLLLSALFLNAQDTIYFNNNSVLSTKISEVGVSEIKYLRFDNLTGPAYTVSKTDIKRIRYANGMIDSTSFVTAKVQAAPFNAPVKGMVLIGTEVYYNGKIQGGFAMHRLISTHALSDNQLHIVKELKRLKRPEKGYSALGTGLFVTGFAIPTVVTIGTLSDDRLYGSDRAINTIVAGAITGALFRIAGQVILKVNKNKSKARKQAFIREHSQNEVIY